MKPSHAIAPSILLLHYCLDRVESTVLPMNGNTIGNWKLFPGSLRPNFAFACPALGEGRLGIERLTQVEQRTENIHDS